MLTSQLHPLISPIPLVCHAPLDRSAPPVSVASAAYVLLEREVLVSAKLLVRVDRVSTVASVIYRGYLLFSGEYQIYFIECVESTREITDIFNI